MSEPEQPGAPPRIELDVRPEPPKPAYNPYRAPEAAWLEPSASDVPPGELRPVPWEDDAFEPSWWNRLKSTLGLTFKTPMEMADRIPVTDGFWKPYFYLLVCSVPVLVFSVIGQVVSLAIQGVMFNMTGASRPSPFQELGLGSLGVGAFALVMILFFIVIMPIFMFLGIFIGGAINHVFLWMFGGTHERVGLGQTIRLYAYAQGAYQIAAALSAIPIVGCIFLLVLVPFIFVWLTYQGLALARMHRTESWRGVCAVFAPMVLVICCLAIGFIAFASALAKSPY